MQYYLKSLQRFMVRHAHGLQPVHYRMIQFFVRMKQIEYFHQ